MHPELSRMLGSRLGRNALLNLAGLAVPLVVAAFALPLLTRALGAARFGLLGMSWAFLEYLTLFDIGLGKATVRYVADALARDLDDVAQITAVSVASQLALGSVAGLLLGAVSPFLVEHVFHVQGALRTEATALFVVVGLNLPVVLAMVTLRGVLEGAQRFEMSNLLKLPATSGTILILAFLASRGHTLPSMLLWVLAWRVLTILVTTLAIMRVVPRFRIEPPRDWRRLRGLISFGGWVAISGVVSPMLVYFDRFALGARSGLAAVGYYTAPYEGIMRLIIVPVSLMTALFPLLTGLSVTVAGAQINRLFASSARILVITMCVPASIAFMFAPQILGWWMGPSYAAEGSVALRILAVGLVVNSLACLPYTFLEASGRPDVPAKFHLLELAIHVPLAWYLVGRFSINGAALAWTLRVVFDTLLLLSAAQRIIPVSLRAVVMRPVPPSPLPSG